MPCLRSHRALAALALGAALIAMTAVAAAQPPVPGLIRFGGVIAGAAGNVTVTFSLYADQASETALWHETQTVALAAGGRYVVSLGVTQPDGLPLALFATGEARWLGVRPEGQVEQPRVLLVSVPYALKAADAETIGGKPLSAFVLAGDTTGTGADGLTYVDARVLKNGLSGVGAPPEGAGSAGYIGMFQDATTLVNSVIFQNATSIGVGTTAPAAAFHSVASAAPGAFFDVYSNALGALPVVFRAARGTPAAPTAVQTDDILGGLAVRGYGTSTFSAGQGQVMFKAAENWTNAAHGTYLQFTTTPVGGSAWAERMRIDPAGNVGIGTPTPAQKLSVAGTVESTTGGFKFPDGTTQTSALSLAANTFTATQTISSGNLALPATTSVNSGVLTLGGQPFLHAAGAVTYPNTFVGTQAGSFLGAGNGGNVAVGYQSLAANTGGQYNTALGAWSLQSNTTGGANTAVGQGALNHNFTASSNTAVGYGALSATTTGSYNAALGTYALTKATGQYNSAFGFNALGNATSPDGNSAFGYGALTQATTATGSSAFGYLALTAATANFNSAFGYQALAADTTGLANDAFGYQTLMATTTGSYNAVVGSNSFRSNITGSYNTALGRNIATNGTGDSNAGVGYGALYNLTTGSQNTALGIDSGYLLTTGTNNTFVGYFAATDAGHAGITNATAIGANALVTQSNSLVLGGLGSNAVSVGIGTSAPDTTLQVVGDIKVGTSGTNGCLKDFSGAGIAGTCSSDARLKTNVRPFGPVLDRVALLQPVRFDWRVKEYPQYHFGEGRNSGLIAQDVEKVFPEMVAADERGFKTVNYSELPYLTLAAVGELKAENDELRARIAALEKLLAEHLKK
jgi:hypothetical protein